MTGSGAREDGPLLEVLERSKELGFLGPGAVRAHVLHARAFLPEVADASTVLDLGSGGGVPGLVLAWDRPGTELLLLDAMEKRCRFLEWAVDRLDRPLARVRCGRAEELARDPALRGGFDVVTARSFAPPPVAAECAAGFLHVGGRLVVSEPPQEGSIDRWPAGPLDELGMRPTGVSATETATLQVVEQFRECPERFPRRVGVPAKRPLF